MSLFNQLIPNYVLNDKRQIRVAPQMPEPVYIDDAFDPLFNKRAQAYLNAKYGRFLRIPAGYAEMIENMLGNSTKQWGPLGPGMGILGTFGRTIDKAEDFLLGGITEASHLAGNLNPLGSYTPVKNPLREVFVEDKDYTGQRLLASMANNMSKLAGTSLTENDFNGAWNIPSLGIEIATDPGILGGAVSRHLSPTVKLYNTAGDMTIAPLQKAAQKGVYSSKDIMQMLAKETNIKSAVGEAGQLLSNFDDVLTKMAWDMSAPGLRPAIGKLMHKIDKITPTDRYATYVNEATRRAQEIDELDDLVKEFDDTSKLDKVRRLTLNPSKTISEHDSIKQLLADVDASAPITSDFHADIYERVKNITDKLEQVTDADRKTAVIKTILEDFKNENPEFLQPFKDYLEKGTPLPALFEEAVNENVLKMAQNDADVLDKLKSYNSQLKTKMYADYNKGYIDNLQNVIDLKSKTEAEQLNSIKNLQDSISSPESLHDLENYLTKEGRNFPKFEISEELIAGVKDDVYKDMSEGAENYAPTSVDEFEKNVRTPGTREFEIYNKKVRDRLRNNNPLPVKITPNRYKIITDTMTKTGYMPYVQRKFISIAKKVAKGDEEFYKQLVNAAKKGDFMEYYDLLASEKSAMRPIFEAYYELNPKVSKQLENSQKLSKTKVSYPFLDKSLVGEAPERYHARLKNFLDTIFNENEFTAQLDASENLGIFKGINTENADKVNDFRKYSLRDATSLLPNHLKKYRGMPTKKSIRELSSILQDFEDLHNMVEMVEIGAKEDAINRNGLAVIDHLKTMYKEQGIDPFLRIGKDGKRGFNYDLMYHLQKSMPYNNIELNEAVLKNYNVDKATVYENLNKNYPFLGNFSYNIGKNDFIKYEKPIKKFVNGKEQLIKGEYVRQNTIENFYNILDSKGTPEDIVQYMDENVQKTILKYNKNEKWYTKYLNEKYLAIQDILEETPAEDIKYFFSEEFNPNHIKAREALSEFTGIPVNEIDSKLDEIRHTIAENTEENRLFTKIHNTTNNVFNLDLHKDSVASVRQTQKQLKRIEDIRYSFAQDFLKNNPTAKSDAVKKAWEQHCYKYQVLRDAIIGDTITKDNFLNEFIDAHGVLVGSVKAGTEKPLVEAIYNNARIINGSNQLVIPFTAKHGDRVVVGLKLNTANKDVINLFKKDVLNKKLDGFQDIVYAAPRNLEIPKEFEDLHKAINDVNASAANYYKTMRINNVSLDYSKHLYTYSKESINELQKFYKSIGIDDIDDIRQCGSVLQEVFNNHGAFMNFNVAKSLRGNIYHWNSLGDVFETDLSKVSKATLTDGIFENHKTQMFIDLCLNDNTKVSSYARDWQDLKRIVQAKDAYGDYSGNLKNMTLASCVFDENGGFVKFKKYDGLTDKGLQEAFENNAFYVPTNMFAMLDKMVKKDAKMSGKIYPFINKYLMLPFKFGTLANPGFLVGNFSDAYMKQALTLSQKYGTSVAEEFANVSASIMDIIHLNNKFDEIYRNRFLTDIGEKAVKEMPYLKISSKAFEDVKVSEKFMEWYKTNKNLLTKAEQDNVDLLLYINRYIPTMTGDLKSFDLEDVAKYSSGHKWEVPKSKVEKVMMGNHYNPKNITTWGVMAGNPVSSAVMRYSGDIETLFRSASVLNDLKHAYGNTQGLIATIGLDPSLYAKRHKELTAKTIDAINLMNAANFNYDNISDFMQGVSYFMPFPTFYLKNIGYWLEVLEEHPEYIDTIVNTQNTMWHGIDTTKDNFQAEAKGRGSLPMSSIIGQKPSKVFKGVLKPTMTNSMFSAFSTINNPLKDVANRVNPIASPITRHLQEPENVKYRQYSTDPYEKNIKQGDKNFNKLTYTFHRLNPYDRFLNTYLRTPAKIKTNQAQMSDFLPSIFQPDYSRKEKAKK